MSKHTNQVLCSCLSHWHVRNVSLKNIHHDKAWWKNNNKAFKKSTRSFLFWKSNSPTIKRKQGNGVFRIQFRIFFINGTSPTLAERLRSLFVYYYAILPFIYWHRSSLWVNYYCNVSSLWMIACGMRPKTTHFHREYITWGKVPFLVRDLVPVGNL